MEERIDIYQRVTNQIIAAIEAGAGDWKMPWHTQDGTACGLPFNLTSGKAYRGVNTLILWATAQEKGYGSPVWGTYRQWAERGCQVRKGEQSTCIVFWKIFENDEADQPAAGDEDGENSRRFMARGYAVFNAVQVEGYKEGEIVSASEAERVTHAESFFAALGADIRHGGNKAFYSAAFDYVQMPVFAAFKDPIAYYSTLAHETCHWTAAPARCDRDLSGRFGNEAYAAEELCAELGAAFLCADLGLAVEPRLDHAAYIQNWLKVLKDDKRAIFTAASKAQQAADWMHARQPMEAESAKAA